MAVKKRASRTTVKSIPVSGGTVTVSIPAQAFNDLKAFQRIQASILDRLGCHACCSGFDIRYDVTRSFAVDTKLNIHELRGGGGISVGG